MRVNLIKRQLFPFWKQFKKRAIEKLSESESITT